MAISGSQNFVQNGASLVQDSLALIGEYTESQTPSAYQMQQAYRALNRFLKRLGAVPGLNLWTRKKLTLILEIDKQSYSAGASGYYLFSGEYLDLDLTAAAVAGATTLALDSSDCTVGDTIGVLQDDDTYHWTTIATIPGATSVTITAGLVSAAASGQRVVVHGGASSRPLRILHATFVQTSGIEIPVTVVGLNQYREFPDKTSTGACLNMAYDPQLDNGTIYVWPVASENEVELNLLVQKTIDDIDASTDDFEVPQEWLEVIVYGLAARLADIYQLPSTIRGLLWNLYKDMLAEMVMIDSENTSILISPDTTNG